MRRFSGRLVAVVVLVLCLSVVPVGVASASPWSDLGWEGGFSARVELAVAWVLARLVISGEESGRGMAVLDEGSSIDMDGAP